MEYPTPHGDKLHALLNNKKLPKGDLPRVRTAIQRYEAWIAETQSISNRASNLLQQMVSQLDSYKTSIDLDLIFDSKHDFLYRQSGQLKIGSTIIEEFLPRLIGRIFSDRLAESGMDLGPKNALSRLSFDSGLVNEMLGSGLALQTKDYDFALSRPLFIKASHYEDFSKARSSKTHLAYLAAEIKTNLDKTMFQEASATAHDLRLTLPNSRYFLLCEWLDMTPLGTAGIAIEEVIVLRKAKRISAEVRKQFSTAAGRRANREALQEHLRSHPLNPDAFQRLISHVDRLLEEIPSEQAALERGWF